MKRKNKTSKVALEHKVLHLETSNIEEVKAEDGTVERSIEGYASTFGNVDSYGDTVRPGAFKKTLQDKNRGRNVKFLYQHHSYEPIGVPVEIREDKKGLFFKAIFADTTRGNDAYELAKMGALDGFSIGYRPVKYEDDNDKGTRELIEIELGEVSLVTFEADVHAKVTNVKSEEAEAKVLQGLIELGYTKEEAETAIKELSLEEVEPGDHSTEKADDSATKGNDADEASIESRKAESVLHSLQNLKNKLTITE